MRCRLVGSDARVGRGKWCVDDRMAPDGGWCESGETCAPQSVRADQGTATRRGLRKRSAPGCSPCRSAATACARWFRFVEFSSHHASKFTISQIMPLTLSCQRIICYQSVVLFQYLILWVLLKNLQEKLWKFDCCESTDPRQWIRTKFQNTFIRFGTTSSFSIASQSFV
jgi:hypothetical protein